jgi:HK97 family phage portal protein
MSIARSVWDYLTRPIDSRAFVTGSGVVDRIETTTGHDASMFQPMEYGDYIATSLAVYAAANLRAKLLSSLPLQLHRVKESGDKDEVTSGPLFDLLHKVNPFWTFGRLLEMTELSLCLWGAGFWFLERGERTGTPQEIWWARPDRVKVVPHATEYISGYLYQSGSGEEIPYKREDVIWLRYPNPLDQFSGLSPLASARLSADVALAANKSNRNIFTNGLQMAGIIGPPAAQTLTEQQAKDISLTMAQRFKGVDKAHRIAVMRYETQFQPVAFSPKDAEFLGAMQLSLEDICRVYGVPLDMLGGQRTYANLEASERIMWANTIRAEARFLGNEMTEQLLPMFPGQADLAEFDFSGVDVLQEDRQMSWQIASDQITKGALLINEWRADQGLDDVPWGDAWWAPFTVAPIRDDAPPAAPEPAEPTTSETEVEVEVEAPPRSMTRAIAYGSPEHERLWRLFTRRTEAWERKVGEVTTDLMQRQRTSVLSQLHGRAARAMEDIADEPFDKPSWIKKFRLAIRPVLHVIVQEAGQNAMDDVMLAAAFDVSDPAVIRFLEGSAQRFAREINETTWNALKAALSEGIQAGEGIDALADRVELVMGDRIQSSKTTIARTETIRASNGGTLESWRQSGVVETKTWLAALDERTRSSHVSAHGQTVGIDEDFIVGSGSGPAPGQIGPSSEDVNCRCSMTAGLDELPERTLPTNGHKREDILALTKIVEALR